MESNKQEKTGKKEKLTLEEIQKRLKQMALKAPKYVGETRLEVMVQENLL